MSLFDTEEFRVCPLCKGELVVENPEGTVQPCACTKPLPPPVFLKTKPRPIDWASAPYPRRPDPGREQVGRFHRNGQSTEMIAAALVAPRSGSQREKVLAYLRREGEDGATDYELWAAAGIGARPHVPGTRREELIADGWPIVDSGQRRMTDTGSPAIVWVYRPR